MKIEKYKIIEGCRTCGEKDLSEVISMGVHPLANSLKSDLDQIEKKIPLTLVFCPTCSLVQIKETVDKEILFKSYVWVTGTSKGAVKFSQEFHKSSTKQIKNKNLFVIEVASNDGTFLEPFKRAGHKVLGVDPAENIAHIANSNGIPTISEFFELETAKSIVTKHGQADLVFARNVVPHVDNLHEVIAGIECCLKHNGVGAIEFHHTQSIFDENQYDSIYHEHLSYFSLHSMCYLLDMHHLHPFDVLESPISGGALVVYFSREKRAVSDRFKEIRLCENDTGILDKIKWKEFGCTCIAHKKQLVSLLEKESKNESRVIGYGASARSSTLLNFCGINSEQIPAIIDKNPLKHGLMTPGSNIPIISLAQGLERIKEVDKILLLAWNFKEEIISDLRSAGFTGQFIVPLPNEPYIT